MTGERTDSPPTIEIFTGGVSATPQLLTTPGRFQGRRVCGWGSSSGHGGALAQEVPHALGDEGWRLLVRREVVEAVQYFRCCIGDHLLEG